MGPSPLEPGHVVAGRYCVEAKIGEGGMGLVYRVHHVHTDERLALKVLHKHVLEDQAAVERFRREARAPARIASEHVARVTDADTAADLDGAPFYVMELLEGTDLERRVRREGPIPPSDVIELLRQTARALDKAHRMGIVHRDLKPENVFLTHRDDGTPCVKLLDFGIARIGADMPKHFATPEGTLVGTPGYMSPEQMQGNLDAVGPASDIWSMGLMAFRLLCGKEFWSGTTLAVICAQVMTIPIPTPTQRGSKLGPDFDAWFARCVARRVDDRFATASEAVLALAQALDVITAPASRASQPSLVDLADVVVVPTVVSSTVLGLQPPMIDEATVSSARLSPVSPFEVTALASTDDGPEVGASPSSPGRSTDDAVALGAAHEDADGGSPGALAAAAGDDALGTAAPTSQPERRRRVRVLAGAGMAALGAVLVLLFVVGALGTRAATSSAAGPSASTTPSSHSPASPAVTEAALHAPPPPFESAPPADVAASASGEPAAEPTAAPGAATSASPAAPRTSRADAAARTTTPPRPPPAPSSAPSRPPEGNKKDKKDQSARLAALSRLCAQGLYTPAECAAKRRAIQGAP